MAAHPTNTTYLSVNTAEESYAPKSPDLSGTYDDFDAEDVPHPQHHQYRGSISHYSPYTPTTEPTKSPWGSISQQGGLPYGQPQGHPQNPYQAQNHSQNPYQAQSQWHPRQPSQPNLYPRESMVKEEDDDYNPAGAGTRSRPSRVKQEHGFSAAEASGSNGLSFTEIEVKTKFPIARIKRIMQADEDVGKVAQVTPVVVSKALELFMVSLVTKAAAQAKSRNSKRVLAAHLKEAITADEQFDFLTDIVSKVADAPAANAKKEEPDSDEAEGVPAGKKKRAPRVRKRKESDEL